MQTLDACDHHKKTVIQEKSLCEEKEKSFCETQGLYSHERNGKWTLS